MHSEMENIIETAAPTESQNSRITKVLDSDGLVKQDLDLLNVKELDPLNLDIISRQATVNIGTVGHVAHGKSTLVKAISGVQTVRFKNELERNITIKLGYANAKIYKCNNQACPEPGCFTSRGSSHPDMFPCTNTGCTGSFVLARHISFVDCPGHDVLMSTMLNGTAVMDCAMLLVAANEPCPQPQTSEHLAALEIVDVKNIVILQNKIDLIKKEQAKESHQAISKYVQGTHASNSPIIPISAQLKCNMDVLCQYIYTAVPVPKPVFDCPARMNVIRSFDINKPGCEIDNLKGGVLGGSIKYGVLKVGQEIEIRPGIITRDENGNPGCQPIRTKVLSLYTEKNQLQYAVPGGLIGIGTNLDPSLCRGDRMVGSSAMSALSHAFSASYE